jgi:dihydrofolate reductase
MRKLVVNTFLTLDGVMQAPGGPEEDRSSGFAYGGWSVTYWDERMGEVAGRIMGKAFDLVLGRKTYEIFAAHWPHAPEEEGAKAFNDAVKHVATRTLSSLDWENSVRIEGDVVEAVRELKLQDGPELQIHGSANLLQTLLGAGVIDEHHIWTFPVVVGTGKRLFEQGATPAAYKLVDTVTSSTGVVISTYVPDGEVVTGSFALDAG